MRLLRLSLLVLPLCLSGCGYVHFGRLPNRTENDTALTQENFDLRTEKKMLQQELTLARKEGEALRRTLEQPGGNAAQQNLVAQLNDTTRELATLRASYAKLEAQRARPADAVTSTAEIDDLKARLGASEQKLAAVQQSNTQLQQETSRLRNELDLAHAENATLTTQVRALTASNADAQAALSQLNSELLAQKEARARAESRAEAAQAQMQAVVAQKATSLAAAREGAASGVSTLSAAPATPPALTDGTNGSSGGSAIVLKSDGAKRRAEAPKSAAPASHRTHTVQKGDTLEEIARQYYGEPARWTVIYAANNEQLRGGQPLKPGMELVIPDL